MKGRRGLTVVSYNRFSWKIQVSLRKTPSPLIFRLVVEVRVSIIKFPLKNKNKNAIEQTHEPSNRSCITARATTNERSRWAYCSIISSIFQENSGFFAQKHPALSFAD